MCQETTNAQRTTYALILRSLPLGEGCNSLYDFKGRKYIIVVDYYSRWFDIKEFSDETSHSVIETPKEVFATHGIPDVIMSENGPQNSAEVFRRFAEAYHFTPVTSSPKYP